MREAEAPEVLHCPCLRRIRLGIEGRARLLIEQNDADAASTKLIGQHQSAGSPAYNERETIRGRSVNQSATRSVASTAILRVRLFA